MGEISATESTQASGKEWSPTSQRRKQAAVMLRCVNEISVLMSGAEGATLERKVVKDHLELLLKTFNVLELNIFELIQQRPSTIKSALECDNQPTRNWIEQHQDKKWGTWTFEKMVEESVKTVIKEAERQEAKFIGNIDRALAIQKAYLLDDMQLMPNALLRLWCVDLCAILRILIAWKEHLESERDQLKRLIIQSALGRMSWCVSQ